MRRATSTLALAFCLLGCGSVILPWDRVELVTVEVSGCGLLPTFDVLHADPTSGTILAAGSPTMWPTGYIGRRVGSEVEILDSDQNVVATTGSRYQIYWVVDYQENHSVICDLAPCTPFCPMENRTPWSRDPIGVLPR